MRSWLQPSHLSATLLMVHAGDPCLCSRYLGALIFYLPRPQVLNRELARQGWKVVLGREEREREKSHGKGKGRGRGAETQRDREEKKEPALDTPSPALSY